MAHYNEYSKTQKSTKYYGRTEWANLEGVFLTCNNDYIARITNDKGHKETIGRYTTKAEATKVYKAKTKEVKRILEKRRADREKLAKKKRANDFVGFLI